MENSESIKEITVALINFHKEVGKVKKEASNPFFKSKYASLPNILDVIGEPLQNSGLVFVQFPDGENVLTTKLMHLSGEWMQASYKMTPTKNDPQSLGSAITYQRRYALGAILGLNIDEDDDGNKGSETKKDTGIETKKEETERQDISKYLVEIEECETIDQLTAVWNLHFPIQWMPEFKKAAGAKRKSIESKNKAA